MSEVVEPRKAAACLILHGKDDPYVLLGRRNDKLRFMGGHYVFPGGRVHRSESTFHVVGAEDEDHAMALHAAAREVFEETGLLCTRGELPAMDAIDQARRSLLAEDELFAEILDRFDLRVHAEDFVPAGRWVTPPFSPVRFDTEYYVYWVRIEPYERLIEGELTSLVWLRPVDARKKWRAGELKLSPPVAYAIQCLARARYPASLEHLRSGADDTGYAKRFEIRCGIAAVPLVTNTIPPATHTNCFIIGEDELYIVDPGADDAGEQAKLQEQIEQMQGLGGTVKAVVLTHSHRDHIGGVQAVRDAFGAPVWAHEATAEQVGFPIDRFIGDNDVIEVAGDPDWRVRCIHTPGHDPGHLCLLEETTKVLLCGDMVANPGTIVVSLDFGGDMTAYLNSLRRLLDEDFKTLVPSHGQTMKNGKEKIQETIDHRLMREAKIQKALDQGLGTIDAILPVAYDDAPKEAWPLAEHALKAHLARLGRLDEVRAES